MMYMYCFSVIALFIIRYVQTCRHCSFGSWEPWGVCSQNCGGGTRLRERVICCPKKQSYAYCKKTYCRKADNEIWQSSACNQYCYNGGEFDGSNCKCPFGWKGDCCNEACNYQYFGVDCQEKCECENGICNHVTGNCTCQPGWTGKTCNDTCNYQNFGVDCQEKCECENGICNHVTGNCTCQPGWTGKTCNNTCTYQNFGVDCQEKCECENGICNHVTGNCTCQPGWTGSTCNDTCKQGHFGVKCRDKCTCLNGYCDNESGNCTCESGWNGLTCDETDANYLSTNMRYGTWFTSTFGGLVGFVLTLICLAIIFIKLRRSKKQGSQVTARKTPTVPTNTEESIPHYEYIDTENTTINNEQIMEQYENLRTSSSYEEMSNYDIIKNKVLDVKT
ncbi:multiple epidermal growth factor-like domains protein 10 isoform X2 [Mytilus trossulus]|uniref:multiple epidermal growth factor-like domains protein 10 isoform X2 n=1 Tax=Mytilus trossulus TaxID=6551 RepID=UPI003007225E